MNLWHAIIRDIEKVEIIRGIPSVAYGNVANGAVIIQRKMNESLPTKLRKSQIRNIMVYISLIIRTNY